MSNILQLGYYTVNRGQSMFDTLTLTNSGNERVDNVHMKVIDTVVFRALTVASHPDNAQTSCLNVFAPLYAKAYATWQTRGLEVVSSVSAAAHVQEHNITCEFKYTTPSVLLNRCRCIWRGLRKKMGSERQ